MKKLILSFLFIALFANTNFAQKFPFATLPTYKLTIETPKGTFDFPQDTLWILRHSQYKVAIEKAKKLELCDLQVFEYKNQINNYKAKGIEQDSLITILKKDRKFYEDNLTECKKDVLKINKKGKRQRLYTKIAILCIPVAAVIGFIGGVYVPL